MDQMQVKSPVFPLSLLPPWLSRRAGLAAVLAGFAALGAACTGVGDFGSVVQPSGGPPQQPAVVGTGQIKVGLILPLSAGGNAGVAAQSMKNAAEMALAEFNNPDIQLLAKDDGGTTFGAQTATQQAMNEGAEIILGPLFAQSVSAAAQVARPSGRPVIAFSTDTSVAARGVYLLSFLPQSDVDRIVAYAISTGRRSFIGMVPDNAYGQVVEAAFTQAVARGGGRIVAMQRYPLDTGYDGVRGGENAFAPCTFWAAEYLGNLGRGDEARAIFERLLGCANDVGLYAEEIVPGSGEPIGNFPQAFTHVSMISAATALTVEKTA